jgi:glucosamine--fructose-6-phosphate aminotransferase (isomerizing)
MSLISEIHEQAEILAGLLNTIPEIRKIAADIRKRDPKFAFIAARGTSDNAGRYANYLWGAHNHLPVALAAPSLFTFYQQPPLLRDALVVGISQSGQSPDIVAVLEEARRQGQPTLVITNEPSSPLASTADYLIDVHAGTEAAVAATKTYTAELLVIAMLSAALAEDKVAIRVLQQIPTWVSQVLKLDESIARMSERYRFVEHCVVLGRGFNYATAFEWSLKLKELTYTVAEPYSSADFMHGPIAIVEAGFPVLAVVPSGKVYGDILSMLRQLRGDYLRPGRSTGTGAIAHAAAGRHPRVAQPAGGDHPRAVVCLSPHRSERTERRSAAHHPQGDRDSLRVATPASRILRMADFRHCY